jgi:hypothetical protein
MSIPVNPSTLHRAHAPDMLTLSARGLIPGDGTMSLTHAPYAFDDYLAANRNWHHVQAHTWRRKIANPIIEHLLLPRITIDVTVRRPSRHTASLITITHIDGEKIDDFGVRAARRVLDPFVVTVPYERADTLMDTLPDLVRLGVPHQDATLAVLAGLTAAEIKARHGDGTLDLDAIRLLHALST